MNVTKIALIVMVIGLGLFGIQLGAGYSTMKKYQACAAELRAAHPGKLLKDDMGALILESTACVESRLNPLERFFFNGEAARKRAEQLQAPAPTAAGQAPR